MIRWIHLDKMDTFLTDLTKMNTIEANGYIYEHIYMNAYMGAAGRGGAINSLQLIQGSNTWSMVTDG